MSRPADYTTDDLRKALQNLPLAKGDILFGHSNLGFFGRPAEVNGSDALCEMFLDVIMERLGGNGTLIVPTFTYSFPRQQIFDPQNTPSGMGMFAEWIRRHPDARRSVDPSYSVAAIGANAESLTRDSPENSFAKDGFFGRFLAAEGKILNLNFDAGSTFLHFVERELGCSYRFDKTFEGVIEIGGNKRMAKNTIYVRYLSSPATEPVFEAFDTLARSKKLYVTNQLGRCEMGTIAARDCFELLRNTLPVRPWLLTKAEAMGGMPALEPEPEFQPCIAQK